MLLLVVILLAAALCLAAAARVGMRLDSVRQASDERRTNLLHRMKRW